MCKYSSHHVGYLFTFLTATMSFDAQNFLKTHLFFFSSVTCAIGVIAIELL